MHPEEEVTNELYFANIPEEITEIDLKDVFKKFGDIEWLNLFKNKKGCGKVSFKSKEGANVGETPAEMALKELRSKPYPNG